jgi:hypothetical protein
VPGGVAAGHGRDVRRWPGIHAPTVSGRIAGMREHGERTDGHSGYLVSESRVIAAEPQRLFDIVANPAMHPAMDGSGTVHASRAGGPERLSAGARFGMDMRLGAPYKITNTVVEFDEPRLIAWRHFNGHVWRYVFDAVEAGTRVTEQWDARPAKNRFLLRLAGFPARNRKGIQGTLARLDEMATSPRQ